MKNAMNRMEEDEALNSSSRKDYTTQNEGEAKWERTGASQKKNETKSTKATCGYKTMLCTEVCLDYVFVYNCA